MSKSRYTNILNDLANVFKDSESLEAIDFLLEKVSELSEDQPTKGNVLALPQEILDQEKSFAIFSDGACRGNPGPGSWGVLAQNTEGTVLYESSGVDTNTTNNKMELEGAIQGLVLIQEHLERGGDNYIFLYSDSKYVVDGIQKWVPGWKSRGWKKADKKAPENLDQWKRLDELAGKFKNLKFLWIKGHAGHPQNERVDELANLALDDSGF